MTKLTDFDKQVLSQARSERIRLRLLIAELSNKSLAKYLSAPLFCVKNEMVRSKRPPKNRLSRIKAMELARQIRARNCKVTLFRIGLAWGLVNTDKLTDEDLQDDGLIGTYDQCVQWQDVFEAAR